MSEPSATATIQPLTWPPVPAEPDRKFISPLRTIVAIAPLVLGGICTLLTMKYWAFGTGAIATAFLAGTFFEPERGPAKRQIDQQLLARPECFDVWGDDPRRREVAKLLCESTARVMKWPNDRFIPGDPFKLVYYQINAVDEWMEPFVVCGDLEKKTGRKIDWKALVEKFPDGKLTLGDLLDAVM